MYKAHLEKVKKFIILMMFCIIFIILIFILKRLEDNEFINDINTFIESGTKILYISNEQEYEKYPTEILEKYEIENLYINSTNISNIEKKKIKKIINNQYIDDIIVIFKDSEIVDAIIDYDDIESLNKFLQKNNIIPEVIGSIDGIYDEVISSLDDSYTLLYVPYKYVEGIDKENQKFIDMSLEYGFEYKMINAYLLSDEQKEKLNSMLQISNVEDQILIMIKNEKIIGSVRGIHSNHTYIENFYEYNFIQEIKDKIKSIDYDEFIDLIEKEDKSVVVITKNSCKYCEDVVKILNNISIDYEINVSYINVESLDSKLSEKINNKLIDLGYKDGFSTPLTLLFENNKLLTYVIGLSDDEYFIDIFTENGIIK